MKRTASEVKRVNGIRRQGVMRKEHQRINRKIDDSPQILDLPPCIVDSGILETVIGNGHHVVKRRMRLVVRTALDLKRKGYAALLEEKINFSMFLGIKVIEFVIPMCRKFLRDT